MSNQETQLLSLPCWKQLWWLPVAFCSYKILLIIPSSHMFSHGLKCLKAALHWMLRILASALIDSLTLPPGFIRLYKRAATTTKPLDGLDCMVMLFLLVQANATPLYAFVLVDTRYPCALVLVHVCTQRQFYWQSVSQAPIFPSIHVHPPASLSLIGSHTSLLFLLFKNDPFIQIGGSACFSISNWFIVTHQPTSTSKGQIVP